ncbi:MAG: hypothetical protein Q7S36_03190 [Candidatus Liptonbacteria bacterium]|nr:hypothetical protein [Candidatus Liptonbacteria bacterium]
MNELMDELAKTTANAAIRHARETKKAERCQALRDAGNARRLRGKVSEWVSGILAELPRNARSFAARGVNRMPVANVDIREESSSLTAFEKVAYSSALRNELSNGCKKLGFKVECIAMGRQLFLSVSWPKKSEA